MTNVATKEVLLEPFVNRLEEMKLVKNMLQKIRTGQRLFDFILTVSGIPGIGKTTFLNRIKSEAQSCSIRAYQINLSKEFSPHEKDIACLFKSIAENLAEQSEDWNKALEDYYNNGSDTREDDLTRAFVIYLRAELEKQPLVILIDNCYYLNQFLQSALEDMLEQVLQMNRLLIILAGRTVPRWKSFELRRRTNYITLHNFNEKESVKLLPESQHVDLSKKIFLITNGYPLASVKAYQWVFQHLEPAESDFTNRLTDRESELVFNLTDSILNNYILMHAPVAQHILFKELLRVISPLRRFDDNLLYDLIKELKKQSLIAVDDPDVPESILDVRSYIRQIANTTHTIRWESAKMAYALDRSIRQLLSLEMGFKNPIRLLGIHEFTAEWYLNAIQKATEKDPSAPQTVMYLIEHIFHFLHSQKLKKYPEDTEKYICDRIKDLFQGYYFKEKNHFYEEFKSEIELYELLNGRHEVVVAFVKELLGSKFQRTGGTHA